MGTSDLSKRFKPTFYHSKEYSSMTTYIFTEGAHIGLQLLSACTNNMQ